MRDWTGDHDGGQQGCGYSLRGLQRHLFSPHDPPGNDANMLALGARVVGEGLALEIVDAFLAADFEGGRHAARVAMIETPAG